MRLILLLYCQIVLSLLLVFPAAAAEVIYCFDGDTVKLSDGRVVRLAGIDTPERQHGSTPAQYYAEESTRFLEELVLHRHVRLHAVTEKGTLIRDRYQRLVAEILLEDGSSVNKILVVSGAAFIYFHYNISTYCASLLPLQREALRERRGFWAYVLKAAEAKKRYVGNSNSRRFFPPRSPEAGHISRRHRIYFASLEAAFVQGFSPARNCSIWPLTSNSLP